MSNKKLIYGAIIFLALIILATFIWNIYSIEDIEKPAKPIMLPPQISQDCGIENCHGLDITCGSNVAQMCDMSYMLGDSCRQYANCEKKDGQCQLAKSPQFESCKSCVQDCKSKFGDDKLAELFDCESKCTQ